MLNLPKHSIAMRTAVLLIGALTLTGCQPSSAEHDTHTAHTGAAAAAQGPSPTNPQTEEPPMHDMDPVAVATDFFATNPLLTGTESDVAHARTLVQQPELPPEVQTLSAEQIMARLADTHGDPASANFVYGSSASVAGAESCQVVSYQGMLSGGVSVCVTNNAVLAVWLKPEG